MAKNLPSNLIIEKNKIATPNAWLILLEITLTSGVKFYLVKNTEDITFQGQTYTAINFEIEPTKHTGQGEIPTVTLRVSNVSRILQAYLEDLTGGIGSTVKITVVNSAYLNENYSELEMTFDVIATQSDAQWVSFTLGAPNPLLNRFPLHRYIAEHCSWQFKSRECNYSGSAVTCKRTFANCRELGNTHRFGGYLGLSGGGIRVA